MTRDNHFNFLRFKWGIGRLIFESPVVPLVIPVFHFGMDQILPNEPPYMLRSKKKVTLYYGEPIDFTEMLENFKNTNTDEVQARMAITNRIQKELERYEYHFSFKTSLIFINILFIFILD